MAHHHIESDALFGELTDGDRRPVDGKRRHDDVDAAAIGEARVDQGTRFVDAPPHLADDARGDVHHVRVVAEGDVGEFQLAAALHVDLLGPVDQDVGDRVVGEQRLERTEAEHIVEQHGDEIPLLEQVEAHLLFGEDLTDDLGDLAGEFRPRQTHRRGDIDALRHRGLDALLGLLDAGATGGDRLGPAGRGRLSAADGDRRCATGVAVRARCRRRGLDGLGTAVAGGAGVRQQLVEDQRHQVALLQDVELESLLGQRLDDEIGDLARQVAAPAARQRFHVDAAQDHGAQAVVRLLEKLGLGDGRRGALLGWRLRPRFWRLDLGVPRIRSVHSGPLLLLEGHAE